MLDCCYPGVYADIVHKFHDFSEPRGLFWKSNTNRGLDTFKHFLPISFPSFPTGPNPFSKVEAKLELDYQLGEGIKEKLFLRAFNCFTGQGLQFEQGIDDFGEDDIEDEDDEDDDEDNWDEDDEHDERSSLTHFSRDQLIYEMLKFEYFFIDPPIV